MASHVRCSALGRSSKSGLSGPGRLARAVGAERASARRLRDRVCQRTTSRSMRSTPPPRAARAGVPDVLYPESCREGWERRGAMRLRMQGAMRTSDCGKCCRREAQSPQHAVRVTLEGFTGWLSGCTGRSHPNARLSRTILWPHRLHGATRKEEILWGGGAGRSEAGVGSRSQQWVRAAARVCCVWSASLDTKPQTKRTLGPGSGGAVVKRMVLGSGDYSTAVGIAMGGRGVLTDPRQGELPNTREDAECLATAGGRLRAHCMRCFSKPAIGLVTHPSGGRKPL